MLLVNHGKHGKPPDYKSNVMYFHLEKPNMIQMRICFAGNYFAGSKMALQHVTVNFLQTRPNAE